MRKLLVYLLILPLFSCDDFLTVESENDVTFVNYFKTESDVELVVIDIYPIGGKNRPEYF